MRRQRSIYGSSLFRYCLSVLQTEIEQRLDPDSEIRATQEVESQILSQFSQSTLNFCPEDNMNAIPYQFEVNFHNQLKARLSWKSGH